MKPAVRTSREKYPRSWCVFDLAEKEKRIESLERESVAESFWQDSQRGPGTR